MERQIVSRDGSDETRQSHAERWETSFGAARVVYGPRTLERLGVMTRELPGTRALLVTDAGLRAVGHVERALEVLGQASVATAVYDGVEENPTTRHVVEGLEVAREFGVDCIIGLGGGSSLDCAKGINFLLTNGGRMEDYRGTGKATKPMLPSLGVPTTAGTGSEAQSYALICDPDTGAKMACGDKKAMFRTVILDPLLVSSVPPRIAAIAGIDAISHAVESHVSSVRNPISRLYSLEAWRLLAAGFPSVTSIRSVGDALVNWGEMLVGAFFAGAAIEHSMLGAAHACANPLTARFPIPHGVAVGILLPHVIRFNAAFVGTLYDELCRAIEPGGHPLLLEERIRELKASAGLAESLRDCEVPRSCLSELATEAENQWTAGFNPRPVSGKELLEIYESAY